MKNSMIKIVNNKVKKSIEKTSDANFKAFCLPSCFNIEENDGINAALNAPSANNLLKKFGSLNARKKISAINPAPITKAINISLINPKILLINVRPLIVTKGLSSFI